MTSLLIIELKKDLFVDFCVLNEKLTIFTVKLRLVKLCRTAIN